MISADDDRTTPSRSLGIAAGVAEAQRDIIAMAMRLYLADDQLECDAVDPRATVSQRVESMLSRDEAEEMLMAACARLRWMHELEVGP